MGFLDEDMAGDIVDVQEFFGKLGDQVTLGNLWHAKRGDHTGDILLHNRLSDLPAHVPRQRNISMLKPEHHDRQPFALAVLCKPESPPDIYRVKDYKGNVVFVQFFGHNRAGVALACAALGEKSKGFRGTVNRNLN
jgi:hypothetical protein